MAGGATTPPSLPFHNSVATPLSNFQTPSAPPCEERNSRYPEPIRGACARALGTGKRAADVSVWIRFEIGTVHKLALGVATEQISRRSPTRSVREATPLPAVFLRYQTLRQEMPHGYPVLSPGRRDKVPRFVASARLSTLALQRISAYIGKQFLGLTSARWCSSRPDRGPLRHRAAPVVSVLSIRQDGSSGCKLG